MKNYISFFAILLTFLSSCKDNIIDLERSDFGLEATNISFGNEEEERKLVVQNASGEISVSIISEHSSWCSAKVSGSTIAISVESNQLLKSRNATIEIKSGTNKINVLVRQSGKIFTTIAAVKNLSAEVAAGSVTLRWDNPEEDNFSHVIITYIKDGINNQIILEPKIQHYTINNLRNIDGIYTFNVQSVDKNNDLGETVSIAKQVDKLVAFGFSDSEIKHWLPFHFKSGNTIRNTLLRIRSNEYNIDEEVVINLQIDDAAVTSYNQKNGTNHQILTNNLVNLPNSFVFNGKANFQDVQMGLDFNTLQDNKSYAVGIKVHSVSSGGIDIEKSSIVLIYYVDDLSGWYTVDRLANSGENASAYPTNEADRRRYIKRTGTLTWETGYLFNSYSKGEDVVGSKNSIQFIKIDPNTKVIHIQQGDYAVTTNNNTFDVESNELTIKYLYRDWAGWWSHERMYKRSFQK